MFGIAFPDNPLVEKDFVLKGWREIPPNLRDFDTLKYSNETFVPRPGRETRGPAQHMKEQLYPDGT